MVTSKTDVKPVKKYKRPVIIRSHPLKKTCPTGLKTIKITSKTKHMMTGAMFKFKKSMTRTDHKVSA